MRNLSDFFSFNGVNSYQSSKYEHHTFYKTDLSDRESIENIFKTEKFDAVMHLAAQAGVSYSLENPHTSKF